MSTSSLKFAREDDYVEYFLFPKLRNESDYTEFHEIAEKVRELSNSFTKNYIWHKDPFSVVERNKEQVMLDDIYLGNHSSVDVSNFLYGITHYGDNTQDEWFIVSLLTFLSKKIKDLVVRVVDSDGEFLLIEAANYLPDWANPNTCDGKVFIIDGMVHIVQGNECLQTTLNDLRENPNKYLISPEAFDRIRERIEKFPDFISESLHRATVFVPIGVAILLKKDPQLIAAATLAFCNRDPIDTKVLKAMRYFPPEDRIYTSVIFTKCLYAMLMHNNYTPDRRTGWNMPPIKSPEYKAHVLGTKLACGFEILACRTRKDEQDLQYDKKWLNYVDSLGKRGYFKNLLEGSKEYTVLLEKAKAHYLGNKTTFDKKYGCDIVEMLKEADNDPAQLRQSQKELPEEDDDDWLNISSDELDNILEKRYGQKSVIAKPNSKLLSSVLVDFLEQKSDIDGVETSNASKTGNIDFDPNEFQNHVHNLLDLVIPEDKWESNSEMSDYEDENDMEQNLEDLSLKKSEFEEYINQMDRELSKTTIMSGFEKKPPNDDEFDDIEEFNPVDIDVNTVKNMVESYKSQLGGAGPAGNLLGSLGIKLENNENNLPKENHKF